ncbi:hypothetical protein E3E12_08020 [Formicincola oecophyllae]|uniref:Uncharacterized protein n=1 Tax=Formicincola oecophyllae TaxID=2558361 RepID=A0A4Y6U9S7_9PROT|nr:hypothetical protein [Formicincola oecophyllae]QDH14142.1 hypothetical protein E3E12_08020 [Formicincola oecophyllae]
MTSWPSMPPDDGQPVTNHTLRLHLSALQERIDARGADTKRLEDKIDRLCDGIQRLSSLRAWVTGGASAMGAGIAYSLIHYVQTGGKLLP